MTNRIPPFQTVVLAVLGALLVTGCGGAAAQPEVGPSAMGGQPPFFVTGDVIVSGDSSGFDAAIDAAADEYGLAIRPAPDEDYDGAGAIEHGGTTVQLYRIEDPTVISTAQAVLAINEYGGGSVFADLNYFVLPANAATSCGAPFEVEGSPFEVEGSPFEVEGSGASAVTALSSNDFWQQTAFTTIGLDQADGPAGEGVTIAVFDTAPYTGSDLSNGQVSVEIDSDTFDLGVELPPTLLAGFNANVLSGMSSHGLFVSTLAHAVAPSSRIQLIRVLDNNACGDLHTLVHELYEFINQVETEYVINLSLGLARPDVSEPTATAELVSNQTALSSADSMVLSQVFSMSVTSLTNAVATAAQSGIVVAAAGNEGGGHPANLPAALESAVGVRAATLDGSAPTCYSNEGDMAAPGGDVSNCTNPVPNGLISLTLDGYKNWAGTSFSTPLVSGWAARQLSDPSQAPDYVAIRNGLKAKDSDFPWWQSP